MSSSAMKPVKKILVCLIGCCIMLGGSFKVFAAVETFVQAEVEVQPEVEVKVQTKKVLAFGDSITYGTGSNSGGYPPKLAALLNANGIPAEVLNYGVRGEPTARGVGRIAGVLAAHRNASYILILEGTNDLTYGLSLDATQRNLEAMVSRSREYGVTPVLATLTPDTRGSVGFAKNIEGTYNPMIRGIGNNLGVAVVDMYSAVAGNWRTLNIDGIHPNDRGYQVIAEAWYGAIRSGGGGGGGQGDDGGGGGCFIATAAFGSSLAPHVRLLQEFRDEIILASPGGEQLVALYYRFSPPVAELISQYSWMQTLVRGMLYPVIGMSYLVLTSTFVPIALFAVAMLAGSMVLVYRMRRRRGSGQVAPGL